MGDVTPRLRMFAGPNGSGKSSIKDGLPPGMLGFYVNPDEIEKVIRKEHYFDLKVFQLETTPEAILGFFRTSEFLINAGLLLQAQQLTFADGKLHFGSIEINSYFASVLSDFIRKKLLEEKISFTFETVMSSSDKVDFLKLAQESGFRTYLYYVSTEDPMINVSRVSLRVSKGGHSVPEDKIINRYHRSLELLYDASKFVNRAYIFDNSSVERVTIAEITDGEFLEMKTESMPIWFKTALWDKFEPDVATNNR
jgi:predicted ABC-type ATPase